MTDPPKWAEPLCNKGFILYVGAFSENKNQRRLIAAWDRLRRQRDDFPALVLIGPSPDDYMREVIEPLRSQTVAPEEILIPGFRPSDEVGWAFHHCLTYVQPSFAEGFGMPVVEAMSCGRSVACSDSTSLPEVAGGAALLFDPSSVESIAHTLETVVFDEAERARLRAAGLERAKVFTWERNAEIVSRRIRDELSLIASA
ncbi:MAG: glycosyltransferase family 1 protein [Chthoniobacterales bacterium]